MNELPPLQLPGEPDALTELRLRDELKLLRSTASIVERIQAIRRVLERGVWPPEEVAELIVITAPSQRITPILKVRLLQVEAFFIERGWRLPRWQRPKWLLEEWLPTQLAK